MTDVIQPRQPQGVPIGGQFAGRQYSEDNVRLDLTDEEYNATGTFLFPPRPRSAAQVISFWENCPVSDDVLENISLGYEKWAFEWHQVEQNKWLRASFYKQNGIDQWKAEADQISTSQRALIEEASAAYSRDVLEAIHPSTIDPLDVRFVARAGQMWNYSGDLPDSEQAIVDGHPVELRRETLTVSQIVDKYNLTGVRKFFIGQTRAIVESLDQVRVEAAEAAEAANAL